MRRITLFVLALMMGFPGMNQEANGQTKVFDQQITWEHTPYEHGGYGFYWWHRTDGQSIINYGDMPSDNWVSPNNYYDGEFTLSIEVIDQPTENPFWIQFGIWADYSKGSLHTETVAARQYVNGGNGSTGSWSLGSPSGWWNKQAGDPLDFSRADDFYRIGVVLWNNDPLCIPMGHEWNTSGCPEFADDFFPLTVRIRVYASSGVYVPPVTAPNYSIDYGNERTNKVISTDDQYSYQSNFSTVVDGDGQYLSLTPGTNVYFRKKSDYSKTQTLTVPYRPGVDPEFGIDYANESTIESVSDEYQYSSNSDMSSATTGNGSPASLTPGSNKYFRKRATGSNFASEIQTLVVPAAPAAPSFGIDYPNERTSTGISSGYRYSSSSDMSSATTGDGSNVLLTPGSNKYFQKLGDVSNFPSNVQELVVSARPAAPAFAIDYINARTTAPIQSTHQYASSSDMSDAVDGSGSYVDMNPGSSMYFRTKASSSAFLSAIQTLAAPARPAAPSFQIDYMKEEISTPIGTGFAYGLSSDMSDATQGSNNLLKVTPGISVYFQAMASVSAFASEIQSLVSPARPSGPTVGINFVGESTDIAIGTDLQYSSSSGFESANGGTGAILSLTPGSDLYFRYIATAAEYASEAYHLFVPERPEVSSTVSGSTALYPFIVSITFNQEIAALDAGNITVQNGVINNLNLRSTGTNLTVFEGLLFATAKDVVSVSVPADAAPEGNFVSSAFEIIYTGDLPGVGIENKNLSSFSVFPNPGKGVFHLKFENQNSQASYKVECCTLTGKVVHKEEFYGTENIRMDLSGLSDGLYLLRLTENSQVSSVVKLIIK